MIYIQEAYIKSVMDFETFFHHLVANRRANFHPDEDFMNYISIESKQPCFTKEEIAIYNFLKDESFAACDDEGVDVYSIGINESSMFLQINVA